MERGIVTGGALIALSVLVAVVLNGQAARQTAPIASAEADPAIEATTAAVDAASIAGRIARAPQDSVGFYERAAGLDAPARAGRELWYKATAGNGRFHTYTLQQRFGVLTDWYRLLNTNARAERFRNWGLINDPGCCVPGSEHCPARALDETYGFDYCPGDNELLSFVGQAGYRDPACDFADPPPLASNARESACDMAFGTSAGVIGLRKFPNPRFDRKRWLELNADAASWVAYRKHLAGDNVQHVLDASIEPPFLIGVACIACHATFGSGNPPHDPAQPHWLDIKDTVGEGNARVAAVFAADIPQSPRFLPLAHVASKSDRARVPAATIQRMYLDLGSCAEQCWANRVTVRQGEFRQTSIDVDQCRRDCPGFRAIEARLPSILAYLRSQ